MTDYLHKNQYPTEASVNKGPLPDVFKNPTNGKRIQQPAEWPTCAQAWVDLIIDKEYGGMPPQPTSITWELQSVNQRRAWPGKPRYWSYKVHCHGGEQPISFVVKILYPDTDEPVPLIINGDACWWRSEDVAQMVVAEGFALLLFDRTELAKDIIFDRSTQGQSTGGLYDVYPGMGFGALSAWAWAYQRCVDLVYELPFLDETCITVSGHSRGGKTTLIAGATDERIHVINDNASCAAGSACFRYVGDSGEALEQVKRFTDWFSDDLQSYAGREEELPFDQHCLLAALAPRPLLLTYALDDRWSNPEGMVQCAGAAKEVYAYLGHEERLAFHFRSGEHAHKQEDWSALLDFIKWQCFDGQPQSPFNQHPYTHLKPLYDWTAPSAE